MEEVDYTPYLRLDIFQYIYSFPRLKEVRTFMGNIETWLPVLKGLPNLNCIWVKTNDEDFEEKCLSKMSRSEQTLILERFSKIVEFTARYDDEFCPNTMFFIMKHFTGLERLALTFNQRNWTKAHLNVLPHMLKLVLAAKFGKLCVCNPKLSDLSTIIQEMFRKTFFLAKTDYGKRSFYLTT